ncbi:TPA: hypothetical protein NR353_001602 [Legionella pneumophila]|uniref:Uncharacterized protein n=1 Tax=Legionella waltersii TaxID=66969 RepID=A0A0W1AGV0_9GAMM|nr:hypothetical protein [Legionella pneumophila]KTD80432.1 hypothetical protein Lwal_1129 [Legionella waltersii]SNV10034.1 Uncharacterised protein [Legionella waltersii]HCJ1082928.1 hypothetical protein [Legionella pneumophila]HCJ4379453.1 hypothetical protein [Legionella pneumophila]HEM6931544.1 hypothetical protein [Legionella pneumophila]
MTLILDKLALLSDEGILLVMSILSKEQYFNKTFEQLLLYAIAQIITEQDQKGPQLFFQLSYIRFS